MYMSGYSDEAAFDRFAETMDPTECGSGLRCPYLVVAGEDDDLSPIDYTWTLLKRALGPREFVLYQGERHGIGSGPAAGLGPNRDELMADWLAQRLAGEPMVDRLRFVTTAGTVVTSPLTFDRPVGLAVAGQGPK
jgi:hypothetical protein